MSTGHAPIHEWHHVPIAPTTQLGKWAFVSAIGSGIGWLIGLPAAASAPTEGVWWPWGVVLLVTLIPAFACAIAASILAFLAMVRRGERAVAVYVGYVPVACILAAAAIDSLFFS